MYQFKKLADDGCRDIEFQLHKMLSYKHEN